MCPGIIVAAGGGGSGGSGAGGGKGKGGKKGAGTGNGEENATADSKSASQCGTGSTDGGGCPNDHGHGASGTITKGDPVDVVTGRVTVGPLTDLFLPGPLPLLITRGYSSFSRQNDVGFGWGWSSSLLWRLEVKRRQCLVLDASGVLHTFPTPDDGEASLGPQGWLLHKEDGTYLLDGSGKVVAEGHNLAEGGGVGSPQFGRGSCAETTALHNLMAKKGIGKGDIAKLFNEEGYTIETYEGRKGDETLAANPCPSCAEMFRTELGITTGVKAHNRKPKDKKPGDWDGSSEYVPTSKAQMQDSKKKGRRRR